MELSMNRPQLLKTEPKDFMNMIRNINQFEPENIWVFDKEGLKIKNTDRSLVIVFDVNVPSASFDEYRTDEKEIRLGINSKRLQEILKNMDKGDYLKIERNEDKMEINMLGEFKKKYMLPLLDLNKNPDLPAIDQLEFSHEFEINTETLQKITRDNKKTENLVFENKDGKLHIGVSDEMTNAVIETDIKVRGDGEIKTKYSMEYMYKIFRYLPKQTVTFIKFGKDFPVEITTSIPDRILYKFILAPRVED